MGVLQDITDITNNSKLFKKIDIKSSFDVHGNLKVSAGSLSSNRDPNRNVANVIVVPAKVEHLANFSRTKS